MKPNQPLVINLNLNWRVLVVLGIAIGILVAAYSAAGAQNANPPTANDPSQSSPSTTDRQSAPVTQNGSPSTTTGGSQQPPSTTDRQSAPVTQPGHVDLHCTDGFLPSTVGQCVPADSVATPSSSVDSAGVNIAYYGRKGHYYITADQFLPNTVLTACGAGYHMASLWELLDVSHLTYDYDNPVAKTFTDSGYGPPTGNWYGWVHTGYSSSGADTTGQGNCKLWTSAAATDYGVSIALTYNWETIPGSIVPWLTTSFPCSYIGPVWCVGN